MDLIAKGYFVVTAKGVYQVNEFGLCSHNMIWVHFTQGDIAHYKLNVRGLQLLDYNGVEWVRERDKHFIARHAVLGIFNDKAYNEALQFYKDYNDAR